MCARPRPETIGTLRPHAAAIGASGIETLSPTPPVECLSATGPSSPSQDQVSPDSIMMRVSARVSSRSIPWKKTAMSSADTW